MTQRYKALIPTPVVVVDGETGEPGGAVTLKGSNGEQIDAENPLQVGLATRIAGEDIAADELKVRQMPSDVQVYTLAELFGILTVPTASSRFGLWVNIEGFSRVTAFLKVTMTVGNFRVRYRMSPAPASPGASDIQVDLIDLTVTSSGTRHVIVSNMSAIADRDGFMAGVGAVGRWAALTVTDSAGGSGGTIDDAILVCVP